MSKQNRIKIAVVGSTSPAQITKLYESLSQKNSDLLFVDKIEDLPADDFCIYKCYTSCSTTQFRLHPPDTLIECGKIRRYKTPITGNRKARRKALVQRYKQRQEKNDFGKI